MMKNKLEMNNLTVVYCRKSEEDKKRQMLSLADQVSEANKLIESNNLTLIAPHFREEKSAKKPGKRIEFYKMLDLVKLGKANIIVCWSANRLARNLIDGSQIIELVQNRVLKIITPYAQYDYSNWFMLMIEFGMSTEYSLKLSVDVKRGMQSKVNKGWRPGLAPLGYINIGENKGEKSIAPDPERFDLVKTWWSLILSGSYTVDQSLSEITRMGLRDRRGDPISRTAAFKIFHNIFYSGFFSYLGEIHQGAHQPMISMAEFNKVQQIISGKFGGKYQAEQERKSMPLSGFIKCGECGSTITSDRRIKKYKNGTTKEFAWYRCKKNKSVICTQKAYLASEDLENQVRAYISKLELDPRFIEWVRKVLKRRNKEEFAFEYKHKELLSKRLHEIDKNKEKLYEMKTDGLYTDEEYKLKRASILKEESDVKEQLNSDRITEWEKLIDETLDFSSTVMDLFNNGDDQTKRLVLQILGSDLQLKDKKLYLEAKSIFIFLRNKQNELFKENGLVGLRDDVLEQAKHPNIIFSVPLGAGEGTRTPDVHFGKVTF